MSRSQRADVRNPLVKLDACADIAALTPEARAALVKLLRGISADARVRANECWRKHKAPMAAYWKAVAVYSRHAALVAS